MTEPLNALARKLLANLYDVYAQEEGETFLLRCDDEDLRSEYGESLNDAISCLVEKGLAERFHEDHFTITNPGAYAAWDTDRLDQRLPLQPSVEDALPADSVSVAVLNEDARRLLRVLHGHYLRAGGQPFSTGASDPTLRASGVTLESFRAAGPSDSEGTLKSAGRSLRYTLTPDGIDAAEDDERLDRLLPSQPKPKLVVSTVDAASLEGIEDVRRHVADWLSDEELRAIVMRDLGELEAARSSGKMAKCVALLAGSVTEALLLDVLDRRRDLAGPYLGKKRFPEDASLGALVMIATKLGLLSPLAESMVNGLIDYRDLIHPDRERRLKVRLDAVTTRALMGLLGLVARELDDANKDGRLKKYVEQ